MPSAACSHGTGDASRRQTLVRSTEGIIPLFQRYISSYADALTCARRRPPNGLSASRYHLSTMEEDVTDDASVDCNSTNLVKVLMRMEAEDNCIA